MLTSHAISPTTKIKTYQTIISLTIIMSQFISQKRKTVHLSGTSLFEGKFSFEEELKRYYNQ